MKLVYNNFNKQTGESIVILADKYGRYIGKAKCHPDDKEYISEFMGCNLAEKRAQIKGLKNKLHITKIKINTIKMILEDIENIDNNQKNIKILLQYIKNYRVEIEKIKEKIKELESEIITRIKIGDYIIKKLKGQQN